MRGNSVPTALCWPLLGLQKPTAPPNSTSCLYSDTPKAGLTLDISLFLKCRRRFHIFLSLYLNTCPRPLISHALTTTPNNFRISPQFLPCTWNGLVAWTHIGEGGIASKIKRWCALGGFTLRGDILKWKFLINSFDKNTRRRHVREGPHAGCRGSPRQLPPSTQRGLIEHLLAAEINLSE